MPSRPQISEIDRKRLPDSVGEFLIDGVQDIDKQCCKVMNGVECGLAYIREQFREVALADTGKKLTEELLVSWLLRDRLRNTGLSAELEECYPQCTNKWFDLVIPIGEKLTFAVEVKLAWKKWVWCDGSVHTSSAFKGYLLGDASHLGTAHDFDKLEKAMWPRPTWLGVLLIGFDTFAGPMDDRIAELEKKKDLINRGWHLTSQRAWPDRKNPAYRIGTWFWSRLS